VLCWVSPEEGRVWKGLLAAWAPYCVGKQQRENKHKFLLCTLAPTDCVRESAGKLWKILKSKGNGKRNKIRKQLSREICGTEETATVFCGLTLLIVSLRTVTHCTLH